MAILLQACIRPAGYSRHGARPFHPDKIPKPVAFPFNLKDYQQMTAKIADETRSVYRLEEQVGFVLRLAGQRHATIFQELAPLNLTPTQFSAMIKLLQLGECSQNELGRRTAMDVATIKGVIDRLRHRNLVEMRSDPNDKRRSLLKPVDSSEEFTRMLYDAGHEITERTLSPLTPSERDMFLKLLAKIA